MKFTTVALLVSFLVSVQAAPSTIPSSEIGGINADVNLSLSDVSDALQRVWKATSCLGTCRSSWGWSGHHLGSDPYGAVLKVGDPVPYSDTNNQANAPSYSSSSSSELSTSTSDPGLAIQDVTLSAEEQRSTVEFSVYSVTRVETTTSAAPTTSSTPPPAPTTTSTQDPPPPPPPTTSSTQDPAPSPTPDQSNENQDQNNGSQNNDSASTNNESQNNNSASTNNSNQGSTGSTSSSDQQQYLDLHNAARSQHGASPVTWSDELEGFAQQWANNCQFMHSGGKFGRVGENLAAGTGSFGIADGIGAWMAEQPQYDPNNPVASHFTQVVWKGTTQIGCASATCSGIFPGNSSPANFIVCEYSPAGNVIGQFAENVQK